MVSSGVSVIIPAYNYAGYLPAAVRSALQQTISALEVVVVDDGSTDDTAAVMKEFSADERVKYIYKSNEGLPAARNTGIRNSRYPFIGFLDADDEWMPDMLQKVLAAFDRIPSEFAMVAGAYLRMDPNGIVMNSKRYGIDADCEITHRDLLIKNRVMVSTVVVRRSVFDEVGMFDDVNYVSEDRDMWIRISARKKVYYLADILGKVRKHPTNMSKQAGPMKTKIANALRKASRSGTTSRLDVPLWLRVWSIYYMQAAWLDYGEGGSLKAIRDIVISLWLWPFFPHAQRLEQPPLFRLRALCRFAIAFLRPSDSTDS